MITTFRTRFIHHILSTFKSKTFHRHELTWSRSWAPGFLPPHGVLMEYCAWYGVVNVTSAGQAHVALQQPCLLRESTRQLLMYSLDKRVFFYTLADFHIQKRLKRSTDFCFKLPHILPPNYRQITHHYLITTKKVNCYWGCNFNDCVLELVRPNCDKVTLQV